MINEIINAVQECTQQTSSKKCVLPYDFSKSIKSYRHQFLIMIKPECLNIKKGVDVGAILKKFFEMAEHFHIKVNAIYAMNGDYLKNNHIMEQQYRMLNLGARHGISYMSQKRQNEIIEKYSDTEILGAFEFLNRYSSINEISLERASHKKGSDKLGNGSYLFVEEYDNKKFGIVNAFHPHQLSHFYKTNNVVITFDCSSNTGYNELSSDFVGFFNPKFASKLSLRGYLYSNYKSLGLDHVGIFLNGFHISPSPLEGMFATLRYCVGENGQAVTLSETRLGYELLSLNLNEIEILALQENPYINYEKNFDSLFSIAEDNNLDFVLKLLKFYLTQ